MKYKIGDLVSEYIREENKTNYGIVVQVYHNTLEIEWLHDNSKTINLFINRRIKKVS
jgi:hypothetical protein